MYCTCRWNGAQHSEARYRLRKRFLRTPSALDAPVGEGGFRRNIPMPFGTEKPELCGYPMVKKFENTFIRFDRIHERDGRTYGKTDTA